jgi:hypothetical protein
MHRIKSFSVLRTSTTMGILMFLFVLVPLVSVLLIGLLLSLIPHAAVHQHAAVHPAPHPPDVWFVAAMPFLEGIAFFFFTALSCWLYNRIAGFTGGIELNVVRLSEALTQTSPTANL